MKYSPGSGRAKVKQFAALVSTSSNQASSNGEAAVHVAGNDPERRFEQSMFSYFIALNLFAAMLRSNRFLKEA